MPRTNPAGDGVIEPVLPAPLPAPPAFDERGVVVLRAGALLLAAVLRELPERDVLLRRVVVAVERADATGVTSTVALAAAEAGVLLEVEVLLDVGVPAGVAAEAATGEAAALEGVPKDTAGLEAEERRRGVGVAMGGMNGMERRRTGRSVIHPASSDQ